MTRKMAKCDSRATGPDGADPDHREHDDKPSVGRRRLLTGGGVVAAGMVGAGLATAAAGPASAAAGDPVLQGALNSAGAATVTELNAANPTTPAFILTNTGVDTTTTPNAGGPALRLTPSAQTVPSSATGGDLTSTADGNLWYTHPVPGVTPSVFPAPVHTDYTGNVYAPLLEPSRVLDTRSVSGRGQIVNPSGNLDSHGRLKAGKTIYISLDTLVYFAEVLFANLTVTQAVGPGFVTLWPGATSPPNASSINFVTNETIANFVSSGTTEYSAKFANVVAIYASQTTQVILDVAGFELPGFEYAIAALARSRSRASRLKRAQQAMRDAKRA